MNRYLIKYCVICNKNNFEKITLKLLLLSINVFYSKVLLLNRLGGYELIIQLN